MHGCMSQKHSQVHACMIKSTYAQLDVDARKILDHSIAVTQILFKCKLLQESPNKYTSHRYMNHACMPGFMAAANKVGRRLQRRGFGMQCHATCRHQLAWKGAQFEVVIQKDGLS